MKDPALLRLNQLEEAIGGQKLTIQNFLFDGRYMDMYAALRKDHCAHKLHQHHNDELSVVLQNSIMVDSAAGIQCHSTAFLHTEWNSSES